MPCVVLDTNIIVSALWNPQGVPARIWQMCLCKNLHSAVSHEILFEYENVLSRDKFSHKFSKGDVSDALKAIQFVAKYYVPQISIIPHFTDETDRKFYDLAKIANAYLITGNIKHFPTDAKIITPADFIEKYQ